MTTPKYKHFKFEDRYVIQEFLRFELLFHCYRQSSEKRSTCCL